jgi:mitochondrial tryparedoxin peroxidase, trypanosomatid typical 2-Cys peroxiredoxin
MDIHLLADVDKSLCRDYGCLIEEGDAKGAAYRATYIIDDKGNLRHLSIGDLPVGRNVEEVKKKKNFSFFILSHLNLIFFFFPI